MNRRLKKMLAGILLVCALAFILPAQLLVSMAASGNITFSDPTGAVGQEITVNMKISTADGSLSSADIMLAYDASALEFISGNSVDGGAGSLRARGGPDAGDLTSIVFSMQFKALKAGSSQITIASQEVYDINAQAVTINHLGNSTVTIGGGEGEGTSDGLLTGLSITPGTLSPAFSPSVDSYSASVGLDVDSIQVDAVPVDGAAVTVEGSDGLQMGENTITIRVTAADGVTVKNYTISVTKSEGGETAAAETETEAVQGVSLEAAAKAITILEPEEGAALPEGFVETTIDIDGHKVTGWIWADEDEHQYCIFYAMNAAGEKNFYRYDLTEKTIQRYFERAGEGTVTQEEYVTLAEEYNNLLQDYQIRLYIIIALIAVSVVLLILVIVLLTSRKSGRSSGGRSNDDNDFAASGASGAGRRSDRTVSREERYMRGEEEEEEAELPQSFAQSSQAVQTAPVYAGEAAGQAASQEMAAELEDFEEIPEERFEPAQVQLAAQVQTAAAAQQMTALSVQASPDLQQMTAGGAPSAPVQQPDEDEDDFEFIDIDLS